MTDKLLALLDRLKAHQKELIFSAATSDCLPPANLIRRISELESMIAAVEAVADEEAARERSRKV
ncbi:hypothetical protein [Methylobacterium brachiatum]|uniref:hypothetical protein n=1 Tax=Methylobacterium brachiatum TaxID=269660 RepID=UPI0008DF0A6E|nr:hypothetical protein [Methylobacterium brachiatum]SFI84221.1 hypothetical protein SAMN02799642_02872 [Methylobacterium brachiatum]